MAGRSKVFFGLEGEAVYMPNARIATAKIINMARSSERFASNSRYIVMAYTAPRGSQATRDLQHEPCSVTLVGVWST